MRKNLRTRSQSDWSRMERETTGLQDSVEAMRALSVFMEDVSYEEIERMFYYLAGYVAGCGLTCPPMEGRGKEDIPF